MLRESAVKMRNPFDFLESWCMLSPAFGPPTPGGFRGRAERENQMSATHEANKALAVECLRRGCRFFSVRWGSLITRTDDENVSYHRELCTARSKLAKGFNVFIVRRGIDGVGWSHIGF